MKMAEADERGGTDRLGGMGGMDGMDGMGGTNGTYGAHGMDERDGGTEWLKEME